MLSIIIPTLNEEKSLPSLLSYIKNGGFADYEIIIADAGSKDSTVKIAESFGCKVVEGGLPAKGRNSGAKNAKGDIFFFIDADVRFEPADFVRRSMEYFIKNDLMVASFHIFPQRNNIYMNPLTLNLFYNNLQTICRKIMPMGAMGIMVKREAFEKVGGFDETITLAEDVYFVEQAAKLGKFAVIPSVKVFMPLRRFEKDGYFTTGFKYLRCFLRMMFIGPERKIKYDFGYNDKKKK